MTDENLKTQSLGQIQIITKTLLIISGIFSIDRILRDFIILAPSRFYMAEESLSRILFYIIVTILFMLFIIVFMIFNNNWLVKKMLPSEEPILEQQYKKLWLLSSLRIGLVFCGLIFFAISADALLWTIETIVRLPFLGRELFFNIIEGSKIFDVKNSHFSLNIYRFLKVVLAVYLIAGAPGFINWHLRRTFAIENKKE